jgi:hypothetical protein
VNEGSFTQPTMNQLAPRIFGFRKIFTNFHTAISENNNERK